MQFFDEYPLGHFSCKKAFSIFNFSKMENHFKAWCIGSIDVAYENRTEA